MKNENIGYTHIDNHTKIQSVYNTDNELVSKVFKMTRKEFDIKMASYKRSSAPAEVREKAMQDLEEYFYGKKKRNTILLRKIEEGKADTSDMQGY